MNISEQAWAEIPDFSVQLQAAMDYAGLSPKEVAQGLALLGVRSHPQHIHRLLKGDIDAKTGGRKRANPTQALIWGASRVCGVPYAWFFDNRISLSTMIERYGDRVIDMNP